MALPTSKIYIDSAGLHRESEFDQNDLNTVADKAQAALDGLASKADAAAMPVPASTAPKSEATAAQTGAQVKRYALEDHQHPRLTSTTYATLDSAGSATVTFTRTFANKPGVTIIETDVAVTAQPLVPRVQSWVQDSTGAYTGCVIRASRAQMLPTINPLSGVLNLLSGVVSGVNGIVGQLTGYNIFGGNVAGATVSVIAVARSDVSSS